MASATVSTSIAQALSRHPRRRLAVADTTFTYREAGSGSPIVLLHGISSSSTTWIPFFEAMPGYRLIAWDAPGYGGSTPLTESRPSAADYAARLAALLRALGVERAILVGHSLGALVAGGFAAEHQQMVRALVLANPASGYGAAADEVRNSVVNSRLTQLRQLHPEGMAEQRGPHLVSPAASAEAVEWVKASVRELNPAAYEQAVWMLAFGRLMADAHSFFGPTLVIGAEGDQVTPVEKCRAVASAYKSAAFKVIPQAGHVSYVESPGAVAREIAEFLRTTDANS